MVWGRGFVKGSGAKTFMVAQLVLHGLVLCSTSVASPPGPLLILVLEGLVREVLAPRTSVEPI